MNVTEKRNNLEINNVATRRVESTPSSNGNSLVEIKSQSNNGNSTTIQTWNDGLAISPKASALSTNEKLNSVLSDIMGPKQDDPAAQYRSDTKVPLEGYDYNKVNDPNHNTPKYIFGKVAQNFKLDSVQGDKAKAEELLNAMVPELREKGLEVIAVKGDRIQVKTEIGYEWVDVVRGAGAPNPGWWWGSEGKGTPEPTSTVQEWEQKTGQNAAPAAVAAMGAAMGSGMGAGMGAAMGGNNAPKVLGGAIDSGKVTGILSKHAPTNEGIRAALPELQQAFPGVKIMDHPQRLDKLQFSNGAIVDVIVGAGGPNPSWGWMPEN